MKAKAVAVLGGVAALGAAVIEYTQNQLLSNAALAALAALIAVGVAALAVSLPGLGWRGLLTGGFFVVAGMLSWTFIDNGKLVWAFLVIEGLVFAAWSFPWLRELLKLPRLGAAWLGLAYWLLGIAGALLMFRTTVAAQRVAYAGVFTLAVLAVLTTIRHGRVRALEADEDDGAAPAAAPAGSTGGRAGGAADTGQGPDADAAAVPAATDPAGTPPGGTDRVKVDISQEVTTRLNGSSRPDRTRGVRRWWRALADTGSFSGRRPAGTEDLTVGIVAAFLLVIAALLLAGSATVFQKVHPVPGGPQGGLWGSHMQGRFWGGAGLLYHPNSIGVIVVLAGVRIGLGRAFALWQRLAALALTGLMLYLIVSRTALLYAGVAAVLHAFLLWRRRGAGLPVYRRRWLAAVVPFVVVGVVYVVLGGLSFATQTRYPGPQPDSSTSASVLGPGSSDPTSGRKDTWLAVFREWRAAGVAEKVFGDTKTSRAVVRRGPNSPKLTTDNAAVGALRRGGAAGEVAFLIGLGLLLIHAAVGPRLRRRPDDPGPEPRPVPAGRGGWLTRLEDRVSAGRRTPPAWFTVATVGSGSTIITSDWLLGGTGGTLWILLVAAEATLVYGAARVVAAPPPAVTNVAREPVMTGGAPPR